jgi:hypothetical protein
MCIKCIKHKTSHLSTDHVMWFPGVEGPWKQGDSVTSSFTFAEQVACSLPVVMDVWLQLHWKVISYAVVALSIC